MKLSNINLNRAVRELNQYSAEKFIWEYEAPEDEAYIDFKAFFLLEEGFKGRRIAMEHDLGTGEFRIYFFDFQEKFKCNISRDVLNTDFYILVGKLVTDKFFNDV